MPLESMVYKKLETMVPKLDDDLPSTLYHDVIHSVERPLIQLALKQTGGNQVKAANLLGINRNTLRKKLSDLNIDPDRI